MYGGTQELPGLQLDFHISWGEQQKILAFLFLAVRQEMCLECHKACPAPSYLPEGSCLLPAWLESHAILSCRAKEAKDLQGILALPAPLWLPLLELSLMITGPCTEHLRCGVLGISNSLVLNAC